MIPRDHLPVTDDASDTPAPLIHLVWLRALEQLSHTQADEKAGFALLSTAWGHLQKEMMMDADPFRGYGERNGAVLLLNSYFVHKGNWKAAIEAAERPMLRALEGRAGSRDWLFNFIEQSVEATTRHAREDVK